MITVRFVTDRRGVIAEAEMPDSFYNEITHQPIIVISGKPYAPLFGQSAWEIGDGKAVFSLRVREWSVE